MAGEHGARLRSLDTREAAKLLGLDRDLLPEADTVGGTTKEGDTVGVKRLVDGGGARLGAVDGDAAGDVLGLLAEGSLVALTKVLDNRGLHGELDKIHGQEPDDIL